MLNLTREKFVKVMNTVSEQIIIWYFIMRKFILIFVLPNHTIFKFNLWFIFYSIDCVVTAILSQIHRIPESTSLLSYRFVGFTLFCSLLFASVVSPSQRLIGKSRGHAQGAAGQVTTKSSHAAIVISDILTYRTRLACVNHSHHINEFHKV